MSIAPPASNSVTNRRELEVGLSSIPRGRLERRKRRNGFRQSGADWETAAACVKMEDESSVLIRPLIATPAQGG
jgi:hypothetical protein